MDIETARQIVHVAAQRAHGLDRIQALADELKRYDDLGNATLADETVRTLDDLAGHYRDGKFIGGRDIIAALKLTQFAGARS